MLIKKMSPSLPLSSHVCTATAIYTCQAGQEEVKMNIGAEKSGDADHPNRESNWFELK